MTEQILTESASNIVENIACQLARKNSGKVTPNHILTYLPLSLGLVKSCLDGMVDNTSVFSDLNDNILEYEFTAYSDASPQNGVLQSRNCVACDKDPVSPSDVMLCSSCSNLLKRELNTLAETTGWPAQAVYEHELLFRAAEIKSPAVLAEQLAGSSRYTLRGMREKLKILTLGHFIRMDLNQADGTVRYFFPKIEYPGKYYASNMAVIRVYPSSVMEEVQIKIVRILITLGLMFLAMPAISLLFGIPFRILLIVVFLLGPLSAYLIWKHKKYIED